jgi:hypothetical protein
MLPHAVFPLLPSDHQSRRPIHAMYSLVVHMLSRAAQQNMQPPIPEAWFLSRQLHQLRAQRLSPPARKPGGGWPTFSRL